MANIHLLNQKQEQISLDAPWMFVLFVKDLQIQQTDRDHQDYVTTLIIPYPASLIRDGKKKKTNYQTW